MKKAKQGLVHETRIRPHLVLEFEEFTFLAWRESYYTFWRRRTKILVCFHSFLCGIFLDTSKVKKKEEERIEREKR